jgi:hypothetical protein
MNDFMLRACYINMGDINMGDINMGGLLASCMAGWEK